MQKKYYKIIYENTGNVKLIATMPGWCSVHLKIQGTWKTDTFPKDYPIHLEGDYSEISAIEYNRIVEETKLNS